MTDSTNLVPMRPLAAPAALLPPDLSASGERGGMRPVLVEYLDVLRRRKWVILAVTLAAVMAALVITLLTRPTYTATTQVQVSREQANVTNVQGVESENAGRDLEFYQTQYELLEARSLAERVVRSLKLDRNEDFWNAHGVDPAAIDKSSLAQPDQVNARARAASAPLTDARRSVSARERIAIETLLKNVSVNPIRGSSLIDLDYSSYDPEMSARIANVWVDEFIAQSIARKFDSTAEARNFLEGRLDELRAKVEQSERALVDFATQQGIITLTSDSGGQGTAQIREHTLASENLQGLNAQLIAATGERVEAQALARNSGSAQTNTTLARLREQRAVSAAELAELMVQFEPGYPRALALENQIAELDSAISGEEARISRAADEAFLAAQRREAELRSRVAGLSGQVLSQRRDAIQYNIFQREADTNRQLYDSLLQRYKEIGVAAVSASNIAVIDTAQPPQRPSSPNLLLNMALALVAGTIGAGGLVFLLEQSTEGLSDPSKVHEALGIPLLGSVPQVPDHEDPVELVADPKTEIAESYIAIRSSLAFTTTQGVPKSFMLVSSQPAEGKSLSALALALVLGRMGKRVLLIDADLRNPSAHAYLGTHRKVGLSNYLAGNDQVGALIQNVRPNIDLMASGPSVPSAAELFSSDRLRELTARMAKEYDHVIVDSAPVIGLADAPLVSQAVEAVIFVAEAGRVSVRGLTSALERMAAAGSPIVGAILTKLDQRSSHYGYGYSYSYSYSDRLEDERGAA
ncbi:exopolysaccharide biosynthesis protein [Erythrobacter sp. NAP1]|uniref:GumC family protein n=1 Tax=Erythrobacter sp. NAP1 TaxID=237727 RepID=UPI000068785C|nr:polysaccharide biosynthesis tyrosine autokinase [Erythrobacter sp. NAP1]EAQ28455.1 exopolysaccharide biosynthesis protein [Erythrobacter sp. NAP1]